jgi:CheY-like chemotaxis protein
MLTHPMFDIDIDMSEKLIYIVDDDKVILHLLEYTFKSRGGYEVRTFLSGEELLSNIGQKPDLIVLDHMFADKMTGLETLRELRKTNRDIPVIVLTSQDDLSLRDEFQKNNISQFINKKDYFIDTLIESVENTILN